MRVILQRCEPRTLLKSRIRSVGMSANESVKFSGDFPSVSICGASEALYGLRHAVRHVPVLGQPSGLGVWIGYSHLDLEENRRDAVTWEPTVGSEEVHTY